eukprot:UN06729
MNHVTRGEGWSRRFWERFIGNFLSRNLLRKIVSRDILRQGGHSKFSKFCAT